MDNAAKTWLSILGFAVSALCAAQSNAQSTTSAWPTSTVTLIVGYAPGGSTDIAARVVAQQLGAKLGQTVVVDNKAGASGVVGSSAVAFAKPDGQMFLFGSGSLASGPSLIKSLPYDAATDFAPVTQVTVVPNILAVNPQVPAKNVKEFVDYVKANPGKVNYGSAGPGSLQHIAGALFAKTTGTTMVHIPYKGGAPANADLVAGRLDAVFGPIVELMPFVKSGQIRVLGVTTDKRSPAFPDAPPVSDTVPGYEIATWHGVFAPKGTPPAIVEKMSAAIAAVLKEPATRARLIEIGLEPVGTSPKEFDTFFHAEIKRWRELVAISGASPE